MISRLLYRYVFKRTSAFVLSVVIASMFFERAYDEACEDIFEWINEGRLWRDIKHLYQKPATQLSQKQVNSKSADETTSNA